MSIPPTQPFSHYPFTKNDLENINRSLKTHNLRSSPSPSFLLFLTFDNETDSSIFLHIREQKHTYTGKAYKQVFSLDEKIDLPSRQSKQITATMRSISKTAPFVFQKETEIHVVSTSANCISSLSSITLDPENQSHFLISLKKELIPGIGSEDTFILASIQTLSTLEK